MSLISFSVSNYRSIYHERTISTEASEPHGNSRLRAGGKLPWFHANNKRLFRSIAIYGTNASGKSNLLRAIGFAKSLILEGTNRDVLEDIYDERFALLTNSNNYRSRFEFLFVIEGIQYKFSFTATPAGIEYESLERKKQRWTNQYTRKFDNFSYGSKDFRDREVAVRTRRNVLYLSSLSQWNNSHAEKIVSWFSNITMLSSLSDISTQKTNEFIRQSEENRLDTEALLNALDLSIQGLSLKPDEADPSAHLGEFLASLRHSSPTSIRGRIDILKNSHKSPGTAHHLYVENEDGSITKSEDSFHVLSLSKHESHGTQKLYSLASRIVTSLRLGAILIADELGTNLHPLILRAIVELFNDSRLNPHNAQLIFTTHNTQLLQSNFLEPKQIWIAEKDESEMSDFYQVSEFKIPNTNKVEKSYLHGEYGGVPSIFNFPYLSFQLKHLKQQHKTSNEDE